MHTNFPMFFTRLISVSLLLVTFSLSLAETPSERICGWDIGSRLFDAIQLINTPGEIDTFSLVIPNGGRLEPCAIWGYDAPLSRVPSLKQMFLDEYEFDLFYDNPLHAWMTDLINDQYAPSEVLNITAASNVPYFFNPEYLLLLVEEYDSSQVMPYRLVIYAPY